MNGTRIIAIYLALLFLGVPWYWPETDTTTFMGVPAWVAVAIATSCVASLFTSWLLMRPWSTESPNSNE